MGAGDRQPGGHAVRVRQHLALISARPDHDAVTVSVAQQGLWTSADGAADRWTKLGQGPPIRRRSPTAARPSCTTPFGPDTFWESGIYNGGGVYRTDDNGATFRQLGDAVALRGGQRRLHRPGTGERSSAAPTSRRQSVPRSTDGGATWDDISAWLPPNIGLTSYPVAQTASTYLLGTKAGANSGIFRTTDSGATWTQVFKGDVNGLPLVAKADDSIYWVLAESGGVVKSTDGGATWGQVAPQGTVNPSAPTIVELPDGRLAAPGRTVVISSDGGKTWRGVGPGMPIAPTGLTYSPFRKAFYIWYWGCCDGRAQTR